MPEIADTAALSIRGLSKTYPNGFTAVKSIDLTVPAGDFFALLGSNGAGKSTTIGVITSLVNKSSGDVSVFGYDLDREPDRVKQMIGLVPQEFNFNVFEPVEEIIRNQAGFYGMPPTLARERTEKYLHHLQLWDKRREIARNLSGGMKRRLMIARALVHEPRLLILDEPTAGVDIEIRRSMWSFLRDINAAGTTIILTTHYLEEAESLCRNIAIIDHGEIIENTGMRDLVARLDCETYVLELAAPLQQAPENQRQKFLLVDPQTLEMQIRREDSISDALATLRQQDIDVIALRNKANRLEQQLLRLLGNEEAA